MSGERQQGVFVAVPVFLLNSFSARTFSGNVAGVVLLESAAPDWWMQGVAAELGRVHKLRAPAGRDVAHHDVLPGSGQLEAGHAGAGRGASAAQSAAAVPATSSAASNRGGRGAATQAP